MQKIRKSESNQDLFLVLMIGVAMVTGSIMIVLSALNNLSFLAILGVSISFWSVLLLFFTPTKRPFLSLLKASASASGSNIERALIEFDLTEKGVYLPPQNLRDFESSLVFVPRQPASPLPSSDETNDKLPLGRKRFVFYSSGNWPLLDV